MCWCVPLLVSIVSLQKCLCVDNARKLDAETNQDSIREVSLDPDVIEGWAKIKRRERQDHTCKHVMPADLRGLTNGPDHLLTSLHIYVMKLVLCMWF